MTYRGHVHNGQVVLDGPATLPEGASVRVDVVDPPEAARQAGDVPSLFERLKPIAGAATGLPPDASINVDHYLYGHPRR